MLNPEVKINFGSDIEEKDELVRSPSQQQPDNTAAAGSGSNEEKEKNRNSPPPQDQDNNTAAAGNASNEEKDENNNQIVNEDLIKTLYKAALKDDWKTAYVEVFKRDPLENSEYLRERITENGDTALHIAVAAESFCFAENLVRYMAKDDLAIENSDGDTAFFLVAAYGMVGVAKVMFRKNNDLPGIRGRGDRKMLPIHIAARHGHEEMTEFLRGVTKDMTEQDTYKLEKYLREDFFEQRDTAAENESHGNMDEDVTQLPDDYENIHKKLCKAASTNDWFTAYWEIFGRDRKKISKYATASLTDKEDNALHIAAEVGSSIFIYFLRRYMSEKDLERVNADGNTAFYLAAKNGRVKCAELMLDINEELLWIRGDADMLPIQIAAHQGHISTVKCLYGATNTGKLSQNDCEKLLPHLICKADLFDVALKLLKEHPNIVTHNITNGREKKETFLHVLARTQLMSPELSNQSREELIRRFFNKWLAKWGFELAHCFKSMFGVKITVPHENMLPHEKLPKQAVHLLKLLLEEINFRDDWVEGVIDDAVRDDNIEFLSLIMCDYPELVCTWKGYRKPAALMFLYAISKRQRDIFLPLSFMRQILDYKDDDGNNILHLAGKLSPPEQLDATWGVALQIQQEWERFEVVRSMVDASKAHERNKGGKTPKALFDEEHKQLKEREEKWMKDIANSCMIVATLIATVVFAAAFTVPGGTNEKSGMPRFANQLSFRIFGLADAISLVLSVYSLLIFLVIHTSGYAEKDFLLELPKMLVLGLLTLVISIAAMMVVFCTCIFIVFKVDNIWVRIFLSVSASLPVLHFAKKKVRLLFNVARKTSEINSIWKEGKRMFNVARKTSAINSIWKEGKRMKGT